jgi:TIR domain
LKVFISHSSTDQWIANKIAADLSELGIAVFLDVKDLETGDDFDEVIRRQLSESDELLVLISAIALSSHWVMMEFGAARALGKRLALVLIGVSPNELPAPINRHLARDINQIERYYDELKQRLKIASSKGEAAATESREPVISSPSPSLAGREPIDVGDQVTISENPLEPDAFPIIVDAMKPFLGRTAKVVRANDEGSTVKGKTFGLDVDNGMWSWAERWLTKE